MSGKYVEINFDGLVGPTHNYAGLSPGNLASAQHANTVSHPRQAALQGLAKMRLLMNLGVPQAILPPHPRPDLLALRSLGFVGTDFEIIQRAHREAPRLLAAIYSSSAMWAANAATVSPAPDTANFCLHVSPANLLTQFHRSIEPPVTAADLKELLPAVHHQPLPASDLFADEGAANHLRLCADYGQPGVEVFVYGRDFAAGPSRFPARQTKEACVAIARRHGLDPRRTLILQQSPAAIDAGAFHNDVVVASNQNVLLAHREAFADPTAFDQIARRFEQSTGQTLWSFIAEIDELSLADAVSTYIFNSQIVTLPDGSMALIAPLECRDHPGVQRYLKRILTSGCPLRSVHYVDLRQSMKNGGGPACLRLRVVMPADAAAKLQIDARRLDELCSFVEKHYRESLSPEDLADPELPGESIRTIAALRQLLLRTA
jgi:succinylarginine dihydrolase